jgi:cystathionine beta-lyase/cystathionine gamma-synthase
MGYTITDNGNNIKITDGVDNSWLFPKHSTYIYHYGDNIRLVNGSVKIDIDYNNVDAPVVESGSALFDALNSYKESAAVSSSITTLALTETSTEVLAEEDAKAGASFVNLSNADAYILLGSGTASATNYTVKLAHGGDDIYETPYNYSGAVQVVFAHSGSGNLVITKFN